MQTVGTDRDRAGAADDMPLIGDQSRKSGPSAISDTPMPSSASAVERRSISRWTARNPMNKC